MSLFGRIFKKFRKFGAGSKGNGQTLLLDALDKLPKPLFLLNLETQKVTYLNDAARKILGIEIDEFDPKESFSKYYQLFDPVTGELLPASAMPTGRALLGETPQQVELKLKTRTGEYHLNIFSARLPVRDGHPPSVIFLLQDITQLKKVAKELADTQKNLSKAVEAAQIGFWHYDVETDHVDLSPILMKQFGINPEEFHSTLTETLKSVHPEDLDRVKQGIVEAIRSREPYNVSYRVVHPSGEIFWIEATGAGIYGQDGKIVTFAGTTIDITNEVKAREVMRTTQAAVEHERNNFRSLFRETPEMVCILSGPEHLFVFVNEAHVRVLGFDATGKTVREAQPDSVEIFQILDDVYRTGVTAELVEIPVTVTGRLRYFNLTYAPRRDLNNRIDGIMILGTEITDVILMREAQKIQREALTLALNDAPISDVLDLLEKMLERQLGGTVFVSIQLADDYGDGQLLAVSQKSAAAYGDDRQDLKSFWSTPILTAKNLVLGTIALSSQENRTLSHKEEEVVQLAAHTAALVLERRAVVAQRLASTKALEESENELKFILDSARMGAWKVDFRGGGDVTLSPIAQEIFESDRGYDLPGDAIADFIHPDDRAHATEVLTKTIQLGAPYEDAYRVRRKNGEIRWVELRGRTRYDMNGNLQTLNGIVMDVTQRKNAEEMLRLSKMEAERANAAKSQFLANMSHEIRTPLGAIMGFVGLLRDETVTAEERLDFLSIIERNSGQLLRIVDDILDLSKVEAGVMVVEHIDFSLVQTLKDFASLMEFKAREKGVLFQLKAMGPVPVMVKTDPTRLRQILMNVVGNAIKFTDRGHVELRVTYHDEILDFEVEDTGRGISAEQESHLFRPFVQADASITRQYGGTGLGLVLSRRLAETLGGHFVLKQSQLGVGSTFSVTVKAPAKPGTEFVSALDFMLPPSASLK